MTKPDLSRQASTDENTRRELSDVTRTIQEAADLLEVRWDEIDLPDGDAQWAVYRLYVEPAIGGLRAAEDALRFALRSEPDDA